MVALAVVFVAVPAVTAPVPAPLPPCDPHAPPGPDPFAFDPFSPQLNVGRLDRFGHNNTAWVTYECNTVRITGAVVSAPMSGGDGFGLRTLPNDGALNISDDPNRDAYLEWAACATSRDPAGRVNPWAARLVPA